MINFITVKFAITSQSSMIIKFVAETRCVVQLVKIRTPNMQNTNQ